MDSGEFFNTMNALDVPQVEKTPNGTITGLKEGGEHLPLVIIAQLQSGELAVSFATLDTETGVITSIDDAVSVDDAPFKTLGGAAIKKKLYVGGDLNLTGVLNYTTHTTGFRDLISPLSTAGVHPANAPVMTNFGTATTGEHYEAMAFDIDDFAFATVYHCDHDIKPGGKAFIHVHWSTSGTSTATVKWEITIQRSKGHNQASFGSTEQVFTVEQAASGVAWQHMITETASFLTLTEPDELIMATIKRVTNGGVDNLDTVYGLMCDLHYETDREVTPNKAPNFYGP